MHRIYYFFNSKDDPDYITLLKLSERGRNELEKMQRFDMPGFQPTDAYVREMKRYGILADDVDKDSLNVYELDRQYWKLFELRKDN